MVVKKKETKKIKEDVERFKKFQQFILGKKEKVVIADIDIRTYAKYVLQEGKDTKKRKLLGCLNGKIKLKENLNEVTYTKQQNKKEWWR